jgi:hypothetical protein
MSETRDMLGALIETFYGLTPAEMCLIWTGVSGAWGARIEERDGRTIAVFGHRMTREMFDQDVTGLRGIDLWMALTAAARRMTRP